MWKEVNILSTISEQNIRQVLLNFISIWYIYLLQRIDKVSI